MSGLDWDQPLSTNLQTSWTRFAEALPLLNSLRIPRSVDYHDGEGRVELHGFSDASSWAYAAAVYLRTTNSDGTSLVHLLVAKTKVAPVRPISIPRLELCGALLVARLLRATADGLGLNDTPIIAWSDVAVVLAWIRSHPSRWKPFVANRVAELQTLVPPNSWNYVASEDNPADAATRGITLAELATLKIWWSGPPWLCDGDYATKEPVNVDSGAEEERRTVATHVARPVEDNPVLQRFSSLSGLLRVTALCFRFCHNSRHPLEKITGLITRDELESARLRWIRIAQWMDFRDEITRLEQRKPLAARSPLFPLRPFLDGEGLLRLPLFRHSGVDYAGPILLCTTKGRGHKVTKGYICLFICLSSKAIHLEVVSDLTSAFFLTAYKRFTARRGLCRSEERQTSGYVQGRLHILQ
ncbi:integrase core domain protein [Lasius niger]|uniref:Integrase core domain protein n=1 Tax=Lasius niger TaxID=67767 RepID=A0A0J7KZB8_LASNI|nr:integrase core domain protein [Lasius niger]